MATILIIEDHALSRQMLNTWLGYTGHTILKAGSGEEALAIARQKVPDLIISDILMPGMDGFQLVQLLRRKNGCAKFLLSSIRPLTANHR